VAASFISSRQLWLFFPARANEAMRPAVDYHDAKSGGHFAATDAPAVSVSEKWLRAPAHSLAAMD